LNDDVSDSINVVGEWIYYSNYGDNGKIYKIRIDGTENMRLNDDESWFINIVGDWIIYINRSDDSNQYKVHTDGTERQLLK
jgi:hypothetical protein